MKGLTSSLLIMMLFMLMGCNKNKNELSEKTEKNVPVTSESTSEWNTENKSGQQVNPDIETEVITAVKNYIGEHGDYMPGTFLIDHIDHNSYTVHAFDDMGTHIATANYYDVDINNWNITPQF